MKTKFSIILFASAILLSFIAKESEKIWTEQTKIDKVIDYEKALSKKSEFLDINSSLSQSIYPLVNNYKMAKAVIVQREQTGFLPMYAEYYYSIPDSVLRFVNYDWERDKFGNFFKKQEIWKEEATKFKGYNKEYERIKEILIKQLGAPTTQDSEAQTTKSSSGRGDYLTRNTEWETEEYHGELNMIFESMTYRIRMYYYWKK